MRYRIEWQMGGEMVVNTEDDHTASEWDKDGLSGFISKALDMRAQDIADELTDDAGVHLVSSDGSSELTISELES